MVNKNMNIDEILVKYKFTIKTEVCISDNWYFIYSVDFEKMEIEYFTTSEKDEKWVIRFIDIQDIRN